MADEQSSNDVDGNNEATNSGRKNSNLGAACFRCRGFRRVNLYSSGHCVYAFLTRICLASRHACDRQKPSCSRCRRRGITCTYPEAAPTLKKLQKATETLSDRIRKFGDRLKSAEGMPREFRAISLQRLAQQARNVNVPSSAAAAAAPDMTTPPSFSETSDTVSLASDTTSSERDDSSINRSKAPSVASTSNFSVYPCSKCFKDLQQCDLTIPQCSRCEANGFECVYQKTEPKANHVSQVLTTMNKVMDQWQESIDKMAKDFAQKTRDFSQRANNSFKMKPLPPFAWKITSTGRGLSVESNVNSYNDLSKLVDQFKRTMHISPRETDQTASERDRSPSFSEERHRIAKSVELDDTSSIHTSSGFSFAVWNSWNHPTHAMPQDYPIDISDELTDNLVDLYCRSPCCSAIRLPIVDTAEFLERYRDPCETNKPSKVLIYAICAMAARNAFQLHVWGKRPAHEAPNYNMGKALSMAYCLRGRELLSDCFDEPSMDNCQAAFLLSYCHHQNGYPSVIYIYEWIAFNMAQELGLYDPNRQLTPKESMLVWCLYYFNTWYRVLQGDPNLNVESSQFYPKCPLPPPPEKPDIEMDGGPPSQELVDYYVWSTWYYLIRLQILRHDVMSRLVAAQAAGKADPDLPLDLMEMQDRLKEFYDNLPDEWRNLDINSLPNQHNNLDGSPPSATCGFDDPSDQKQYCVDIHSFARFCILNVHTYYNINKILLYQAFFPSDHIPTSPFSLQCLYTCVDAAYSITQILEYMSRQRDECNVPLLGFLFSNIVYIKLLNYADDKCKSFALRCLQLSVDISKASVTYTYDFEMARSFVAVMEHDVREVCSGQRFLQGQYSHRANSVDSSSDGWSLWSNNSLSSSPYTPQQNGAGFTLPSPMDYEVNGFVFPPHASLQQ